MPKASRRVRCRAKTLKGTPCRALSEPGRRRCRFHGGRSTGPLTPEGKARVAEAQQKRWARWRAERGG
ncbi:HGGxSTG domain-containing protein [Puniceibacterium confluentis]|uniref:HGGxSTG domain-containing protein n=1 Tax=Puniceibacterium confluentis TaxID=1958944 RepID=UPI0034E09ACC